MEEIAELKSITREGLPAAIRRAEHYRLLNQPELAESICLDILAVDPENQETLVVLILAVADQFLTAGSRAGGIREYLDRLTDDYQRRYYTGILAERQARAYLGRGLARNFAYEGFLEAMEWFEQAAAIRPEGNDDAILRWNACVRTIRNEKLQPLPEGQELPLE